MVHQHFMLADNLTVVENIILGAEPADHGVLKLGEAKHRLAELSRSIGAHVNLDALVADARRRRSANGSRSSRCSTAAPRS